MESAISEVLKAGQSGRIMCPHCDDVDVLKSGFLVVTVSYQHFEKQGDKLVKSSVKKSGFKTAKCALCGTELGVCVKQLTSEG
jgi:hypothetical protein